MCSCMSDAPDEDGLPHVFICPITREIMEDPVTAADGHTYDKSAIETWLRNRQTSPKTNLRLPHTNLVPNQVLKAAIQEWNQGHEDRQ